MPSLSDIISAATSQIKNSTSSGGNSIKQTFSSSLNSGSSAITNAVPNLIKNSIGSVTGGVNQAISKSLQDITGAASSIAHGDFSGALSKIEASPSDLLGGLAKTFGLSSGSALSGPGKGGAAQPGNSLAGAMARTDPMLSHLWYALMPDISPIGGAPVSLPWYYVEEATVPFRNFEVKSRFYQGRHQHYPGGYSLDGLTIHIYGDTSNIGLNYLSAWNGALVQNISAADSALKGGGFGRSANYKKPINIYLLGPDKRTLFQLNYIECWPTNISSYSLDSSSSTRIIHVVNFSVGDVFINAFTISKTLAQSLDPFNSDNLISDISPQSTVDTATSNLLSELPTFSA